jgi:hypothetical protein
MTKCVQNLQIKGSRLNCNACRIEAKWLAAIWIMSGVNQSSDQQGIYINKIIILDSGPDMYMWGCQFESQLGHQMSWQEFFMAFLSSSIVLEVGHDHFLPHSCQFISDPTPFDVV